jgi:hypothetical protein
MKSIVCLSLIGLSLALGAFPASAREYLGPRGSTVNATSSKVANSQGGYTGVRRGQSIGINGGSANSNVVYKSNGQGSVIYKGNGSVTAPDSRNAVVTTSGSATYDRNSGYSGQNTTTINGQTYSTTTQNGSTTVINPSGTSQIYIHPNRR